MELSKESSIEQLPEKKGFCHIGGCSYYTGINTSGINAKSTENADGSIRSLIWNQDHLAKNRVGFNSWIG